MSHIMKSSRIVGIERLGGDCGTNRDPQLMENDRLANWSWLTKGRVPERMTSTCFRISARDLSWAHTNPDYVRNEKVEAPK